MYKSIFRSKLLYILLSGVIVSAMSCDRGNSRKNIPPDTHLAIDAINLSGEDRLNSVVEMSWYGTDRDGYVIGYDISIDSINWTRTLNQDSTFRFSIPAGKDSSDITLKVRSIDNEGLHDPTPASLKIPLKNSPPIALVNKSTQSAGLNIGVVTYNWEAKDPDGNKTISSAEIRFNKGSWRSIDPNQNQLTFVLNNDISSITKASLFYGNSSQPSIVDIDGISLDSANFFQIRVSDIAGSTSIIDSASPVGIVRPSSNILFISGQTTTITTEYLGWLSEIPISIDLLDLNANNGESRPHYWNPTFRHIINQFPIVMAMTNSDNALDPLTGLTQPLLAHMALAFQQYCSIGGKLLTSTSFGPSTNLLPYLGSFPMNGIVSSTGQVRLIPDSAIISQVSGNYPDLHPSSILIGISPLNPSADAEPFYRAQLSKLSGWQGDNIVGVRRKYLGNPNNINEVFFSIELHRVAGSDLAMKNLLEQILVYDFAW